MEVSRFESACISLSPLSLHPSLSLRSNAMEISRFEFPNFHPFFLFLPSLFSLDRMEVSRFESAYKSPISLSPFSLPPSLSLCPLDSMKIPRFEFIRTFKFPNFHLPPSLFPRSDERWSKHGPRTNFQISSSLSSSPLRSVPTYFPPPILPSAPLRRSRLVPGILPQPGELSQNYGPPVPRKAEIEI